MNITGNYIRELIETEVDPGSFCQKHPEATVVVQSLCEYTRGKKKRKSETSAKRWVVK